MYKNLSCIAIVFVAIVTTTFVTRPAGAAVTQFTATITHDQEPGGVPNEGSSGVGSFTLNTDTPGSPFLTYSITLTGLDLNGLQTPANANDNVTRAHFHNAAFGINGGIIYGQIDPNNDPDDLVVNPVAGTLTGVWDGTEGNGTTLAAQIAAGAFNLDANNRTNVYFNVHTTDHAGGEIRGQLTLVPEPTALASMAILTVVCGARRRRG